MSDIDSRLARIEQTLDRVLAYFERASGSIDPDKAYSAKELSKLLNVSPQAIYLAMDAGRLKEMEMGTLRKRRALGRDVIAWRGSLRRAV